MKNALKFTAAVTAFLMMTGCSAEKNEDIKPVENTSVQTEYVMQEGDTQVTGEVTEIVGNEVTLALGEVSETDGGRMPERTENGEMSEGFGNGEMPEGFENGEMPEGFGSGEMPEGFGSGEMPEGFGNSEMPEGFGNGEMPEGFGNGEMPEGFGNGEMPEGFGNGEMKGGRGRSGRGSASVEKSGETASYIIPVGMTVTGAGGRNSDYSSISAGTVLKLTLNSDGYVAAAEIL
ncbi:MAG: hypothetical protein IJZ72_02775 [Oscillospiraceae bacterium]|nr:hypothetical protein [Oscillospiraceae bacterium]